MIIGDMETIVNSYMVYAKVMKEIFALHKTIKHAIKIMALYATLQIKIGAKLIISKLILA